MQSLCDVLESMEYPGRFLMIGQTKDQNEIVAIYGITSRSKENQARKLVVNKIIDCGQNIGLEVNVQASNQELMEQSADRDNLVYSAMIFNKGIVVGNGVQTSTVAEHLDDFKRPTDSIMRGHSSHIYEPDSASTPRISAAIDLCRSNKKFSIGIIKKCNVEQKEAFKSIFEYQFVPEQGVFISTYSGKNDSPPPSFVGDPIIAKIPGDNLVQTAYRIYNSLAPERAREAAKGRGDFRVSVACLYYNPFKLKVSISIVNRKETNPSSITFSKRDNVWYEDPKG
ncbi:MAG: IMP cyclohydrolase [Nanoarchaeota archaeon]|nr:IMP cyclohydrolase [Nanoarchaeota archaeon]